LSGRGYKPVPASTGFYLRGDPRTRLSATGASSQGGGVRRPSDCGACPRRVPRAGDRRNGVRSYPRARKPALAPFLLRVMPSPDEGFLGREGRVKPALPRGRALVNPPALKSVSDLPYGCTQRAVSTLGARKASHWDQKGISTAGARGALRRPDDSTKASRPNASPSRAGRWAPASARGRLWAQREARNADGEAWPREQFYPCEAAQSPRDRSGAAACLTESCQPRLRERGRLGLVAICVIRGGGRCLLGTTRCRSSRAAEQKRERSVPVVSATAKAGDIPPYLTGLGSVSST